jgi:hypothetical protein
MDSSIRDGQHDFDFEIGTWTTQLRRLKAPLTGSTDWVDYEGTEEPVWDDLGVVMRPLRTPSPPIESSGIDMKSPDIGRKTR